MAADHVAVDTNEAERAEPPGRSEETTPEPVTAEDGDVGAPSWRLVPVPVEPAKFINLVNNAGGMLLRRHTDRPIGDRCGGW